MNINLGQVVYSKAGRDQGRKFIVIDILDESNVMISDGKLRRVENAKRKKIKHLLITEEVILPLCEKLEKKIRVSNSDIRKALMEAVDAPEER